MSPAAPADEPPVEDYRPRAHSVELSTPEMISTNSLPTPKSLTKDANAPKRILQLQLSNLNQKWKPPKSGKLRFLQYFSRDLEKESWSYDELADLVIEMSKKEHDHRKHVNKVLFSQGESSCFANDVSDESDSEESDSSAAMDIDELLRENNQLKQSISYMSNQIEHMEEHNSDWCQVAEQYHEN